MSIIIFIFLLVGFFLIYSYIRDRKLLETVSGSNRGTRSERRLVVALLKSGIPAQAIFHDLYVKMPGGSYCQIDLVVATKVGLIVFEIKEYGGWIFGTGYRPQWTQVMSYGKMKYRFYNPIMQNSKHIVDLRKQLKQFENIPFYSIVVFYGDCVLKDISHVPEGTFIMKSGRVLETVRRIINNNEPAPYTNKRDIVRVLKEAANNGESREIQMQHIENIKIMLGRNRALD